MTLRDGLSVMSVFSADGSFIIALVAATVVVLLLFVFCIGGVGLMLGDLASLLTPLWGFINSAFITAAFGALGGAYFGQRIVERGVRRKELREEIQSTNAASSIVFHICNSLLSLKGQHVKQLKEKFDADKARIVAMRANHQAGLLPPGTKITFQADFRTLTAPSFPTEMLQKLLFEKLSLPGRAPVIVSTLDQSLRGLADIISTRNDLIGKFKAHPSGPNGIPYFVYFGLPDSDGHIDQMYADLLEGMYFHTDSAIYFSHRLCKDLIAHGETLLAEHKAKYRGSAPKLSRADFSKGEKNGLMPDLNEFADWENMFVKTKEDEVKCEAPRNWWKFSL